MDTGHLAVLFDERFRSRGPRAALRHRVGGEWRSVSWESLGDEVRAVARALVDAGVKEGDRIGIFSGNRPEWTIVDLAAQRVRAVSVPVYPTSATRQARYILDDAEVKVLFASGAGPVEKARELLSTCPSLSLLVLFDGDSGSAAPAGPGVTRFADFAASGRASAAEPEVEARMSRASADDLLTLIYTSGTTGEPKGVMLTHANLSGTVAAHDERLVPLGEEDVSLCFLPLSHIFERAWTYYVLYRGVTNCYCDDPQKVIEFVQQVRPTVMCAVPRFYEKIYATVFDRLQSAPPLRRKLFRWAVGVGAAYGNLFKDGKPIPPWLRLKHAVANRLVLRKIQGIVGGRVKFLPCAGAPLSQEIEEFFYAAGVPVCYGYGLTETTATVSCHERLGFRFGTVGRTLPGVEVRIAPNDEILVRGKTVMKGYYRKPRETAEVFDGEWFRTGDAGVLEEGGFLRITDRIKDLMKTSGGKYVAPQQLESLIGADNLVEQVVVVGEGRKFVTALLVPAFAALEEHARSAGIPFTSREELIRRPEVVALYRQRMDERCRDLAPFEQIKRFQLLPAELTVEGGEITPTMKIRRKAVAEKFAGEIDALYAGA